MLLRFSFTRSERKSAARAVDGGVENARRSKNAASATRCRGSQAPTDRHFFSASSRVFLAYSRPRRI